jgi:50S ribosomal protein L16 3-hydroxylase
MRPGDVATFMRSHWGKAPHARPGAARSAISLLTWETLDRVLRAPDPLDLVTVTGGEFVQARPPRSLADARDLLRAGTSVVIRGAERHDRQLAVLASSFAARLAGEVHVQLYATPGGTNSYGWHYDFEDVFIVQTSGVKDYYFRANTVALDTTLGEALDFARIRQEQSPIYTSRLIAGDWLYIPARWWHLVKCLEDSLSISTGVMSLEAIRTAKRLPRGWSGLPAAGPAPESIKKE